jgi:hypothetical protein
VAGRLWSCPPMGLQSCGEAERRSDRAGLAAGRITGYPEISTKLGYVRIGNYSTVTKFWVQKPIHCAGLVAVFGTER